MDADRNLLFGVIALQQELIDSDQFVKVCTLWATLKRQAMPDLLLELGWIVPADKADVDRVLERKLKKHAGDARASLAAISDPVVRHSLASVGDFHLEHLLPD